MERLHEAHVLLLFLLITALWWGAAQRVAVIVTSLALLVAASGLSSRVAQALTPLTWPLLGCGVWTLLSLLPLPLSAVDLLSPQAGELWSACLHVFNEPGPQWTTVAIDPGAGWLEALKWIAYGLVAQLATLVTRSRGLNGVLTPVFLVAVVLAVTSLVLVAADADLSGLRATNQATRLRSTLVNPNNLAGYLNLGGFCGLGLAASRRPPISRTILILGVCAVFASSFWSGSRAGVAVLVLSAMVLAVWWSPKWSEGPAETTRAKWGLVLLFVLGLLFVGWGGASSALYQELFSEDLGKLELVPAVLPAIGEYWLLGTGRGGFESISQMYLSGGSNVVFRHVETFVVSWLIEWGVPFTALLMLGLGYVLRPSFLRLRRGAPAQAAYVGLLAVFAQNLMDLGLELFSLTAAVVAVLAALVASRDDRGRVVEPPSQAHKFGAYASAILLAVGLVGTALTGPDGYKARERLREDLAEWSAGPNSLDQLKPALRQAILHRPADPYPFIIAAVAASKVNARILPYAAAALERAPRNGRVHLLVGLGLRQLGAARQALYHLVQAVRFAPPLLPSAGSDAASLSTDPEFFTKNGALGQAPAQLLLAVARHWAGPARRAERRSLIERAVAIAPDYPLALTTLGYELLQDVIAARKTCPASELTPACRELTAQLEVDVKRVLSLADRVSATDECTGVQLKARGLAASEKAQAGLEALDGCRACSRPSVCLRTAASIVQGMDKELRQPWEQQFLAASCHDPEACSRAEFWVGQLAEKRGDWFEAHLQYSRAAGLTGNGEYWMAAARAAIRAGRVTEAEKSYRQGVSLGASSAAIKVGVEQLKQDSLRKLIAQ